MSFWFYGRRRDGKRPMYFIGGVFTAAMFLLPMLYVLLMQFMRLIRELIRTVL